MPNVLQSETPQALQADPHSDKTLIETTESTSTPVLTLFNDEAACLICDFSMTHTLKSGEVISQPNLRLSWFLSLHEDMLKVRHGHLSQAFPLGKEWPADLIPTRQEPISSARLMAASLSPFNEQLDKRSEVFAKKMLSCCFI